MSVGARGRRHVAERRLHDRHGAVVSVRVGSLRLVTRVAAALQSQVGGRHAVRAVCRLRLSRWFALYREVRVVVAVLLVLAAAVNGSGGRGRRYRGRRGSGITVVLTLAEQHALYVLPHLESDTRRITSVARLTATRCHCVKVTSPGRQAEVYWCVLYRSTIRKTLENW